MKPVLLLCCLLICLYPLSAQAYVGPGLGLGVFGVILGIITSIFLAIIGIFWYPFKRLLQKFRKTGKIKDE